MTGYQLATLVLAFMGSTAVVGLPSVLAAYAGQEAWLAALLPLPLGLAPLWMIYDLDRRHPGLTLVEHALRALGPLAGRALALLPLIYVASVTPLGARQLAGLIGTEGLARTPTVVLLGLLILMPLYAARQGPEVLGRLAELLMPVTLAALFLVAVSTVRTVRFENLLPVTALGWVPLLQGAAPAGGWYCETLLLGFLLPFQGRGRRGALAAASAGLGLVGLLVAVTAAWDVATFGPLAGRVVDAVFQVTRVAQIAEFLSHLDSILVVVWIAGEFVRMAVWLFALSLASSQWLGLADYRPTTLPLAALTVLWSLSWFESTQQFELWVSHAWPFWGLALGLGTPLLIWAAAVARDALAGRKGGPAAPARRPGGGRGG